MNEMHRRDFLKASGAGILSTGLPIPFVHSGTATPRSGKVIVSIFLRGGQDALNTIVPHGDEDYYKIRPTIAIPEDKVVKLDDTFGLHPALAPLKSYWDKANELKQAEAELDEAQSSAAGICPAPG